MNSRIIMISVVIAVLIVVCIFTAKIYSIGFIASPNETKHTIAGALFIALLYVASLLGSRPSKWVGRIPYVIINVIGGIFFYLFLGAVVLGVVDIGFLLTTGSTSRTVALVVLALAVTASSIGFVQARRITISSYTVTLNNAPASWNNKTAVLVTDTHFGLINYEKFSDKVVRTILSLKPDFVLHGGDFYDGPIVDTDPLTESWKKLTLQVPLFYTPGNHEAYGNYELFVESVRAAGATVLDNKVIMHDGVQIAGVLYHPGNENPEVRKTLATLALDKTKPTILINHPPTARDIAKDAGVTIMVSGHTHRGQLWPFRYITRAVYNGYDWGQKKHGTMDVITSRGVGTFGPPMRFLNQAELVHITFNV